MSNPDLNLLEELPMSHHFVGHGYAKVTEIAENQQLTQHAHTVDHDSALLIGRAAVRVGDRVDVYDAPVTMKIKAGQVHEVLAITPCLWVCLWDNPDDLRDPDLIDQRVIL